MTETNKKKIAVFGGSFNPPGLHHLEIVRALMEMRMLDRILVIPCGPRPDKETTNDIRPIDRAHMSDLTFRKLDGVEVLLFDLEQQTFTTNRELDSMFSSETEEVWHVVGYDLVEDGKNGQSLIQTKWESGTDIWENFNFVVLIYPGVDDNRLERDLPPNHEVIKVENVSENGVKLSSKIIRMNIFEHEQFEHLVTPEIADYINRYNLYRGTPPESSTEIQITEPRYMLVYDENNPRVAKIASVMEESPDPNIIVVIGGDGTMLHAVREHWRLRLPFFGIHAGTTGFLMNDTGDMPTLLHEGKIVSHQLPLLYVEMCFPDGTRKTTLGFNDAWVERCSGQTANVQVSIDNRVCIPKLVSDGVLISTPQGSTGYARAMGASPILPNVEDLILAGSNVLYPEGWKRSHLKFSSSVKFENLDPKKRPVKAFVDSVPFGEVTYLKARISLVADAELLFLSEKDLIEKILGVQFPYIEEKEGA